MPDQPRAFNSTLPARAVPLRRGSGITREPKPERRERIRPVSAKRVAENRERRAMARRRFGDTQPDCIVPWCARLADDLHEILTRARGGSITDEDNTVPTCRQHNEELTLEPDWGYQLGLLKHSGLCCQGRRACSRYEDAGDAA